MLTKITAQYRWFEGASFDHAYYASEHMKITRDSLRGLGLIRLESERVLGPATIPAGSIVAATSAYFPDLASAQAALAAAGSVLQADLVNYTNIRPEMRMAQVSSHLPGC